MVACLLLLLAGLFLLSPARAGPADAMLLDAVVDDAATAATKAWGHPAKHNYTLESVPGFFLQSLNSTNATTFDFIGQNFGLANPAPLHWEAFDWSISQLNKRAPHGVSYRVFYLARHGEGYHNVAEATYGTPAWDDYWSKLYGDGNITWGPDALLTPLGQAQAANVSAAWQAQSAAGAPLPTGWYSSPLTRSADTLNITWAWYGVGKESKRTPVFLEGLRETIGVHTCDERHPKSWIAAREPTWLFEKGFSEPDPYWTPDVRETDGAQQARVRDALVEILDNDDSMYISVTAHSGTIAAALRAIGHRAFSVQTGGMIPVVVKATRV